MISFDELTEPIRRLKPHGSPLRRGLGAIRITGWFLLLVLMLAAPVTARGGEQQKSYPPLFDVRIDHSFPDAEKSFSDVKDLILKNYYTKEIDEESLYWAAIQGMLRHVSPPANPDLSKIWTADQYERIHASLKGEQISLGLKSSFNPGDGSLTVSEVLPNSPADGIIKPLDRILRVDAEPLRGKTLGEINQLLNGDAGREISLTVNRDVKVFDVQLKFDRFDQENVVTTPLTETIAMLEIKSFTAGMSMLIKTELDQLARNRIKGLIVDLRNNPGGVFIESMRIAEFFLPKDHILLRTLQRDTNVQNYVSINTRPFDFEVAILVNPRTASSAEILTACLQDHQKAMVVGTRTYGKGIFEKTFTLSNDSRVKFITGAMFSPKGISWHGKGLTPDFLVEQDDKTLKELLKLEPKQRFNKDVAIITAYKLLNWQVQVQD